MLLLQVIVTQGGDQIPVLHDEEDFLESLLQNFVLVVDWELGLDLLEARVVLGDLLDDLLARLRVLQGFFAGLLGDLEGLTFGCSFERIHAVGLCAVLWLWGVLGVRAVICSAK